MHRLADPKPSALKITWGDGSTASTSTEASLPGHDITPFLVTPKASSTLISVGSESNYKTQTIATHFSTNTASNYLIYKYSKIKTTNSTHHGSLPHESSECLSDFGILKGRLSSAANVRCDFGTAIGRKNELSGRVKNR